MELLGKVVVSLGGTDSLAKIGLTALAKKGAAVALVAKDPGQSEGDIANRIRRQRGKVTIVRGDPFGGGGQEKRLIREVVAEFGRIDTIILFSSLPAEEGIDSTNWPEFMSREVTRPLNWITGFQQARYSSGKKAVSLIGVLTTPKPSLIVPLWESFWRSLGEMRLLNSENHPFLTFTAVSVIGAPSAAEPSLAEGFEQLLALLTSDYGVPLRGQLFGFSSNQPYDSSSSSFTDR